MIILDKSRASVLVFKKFKNQRVRCVVQQVKRSETGEWTRREGTIFNMNIETSASLEVQLRAINTVKVFVNRVF